MVAFRVYRVKPNRSLEFRCRVLSVNGCGAVLRARQKRAVDGRWRLAVVEESAYSEIAPNGDRAGL